MRGLGGKAFTAALAVSLLTACNPTGPGFVPPDADVVFEDDFDAATLDAGWRFDGSDPSAASLEDREGFLRLLPGQPDPEDEDAGTHLLLREAQGDFILSTRIEFDPTADRQGGGLFVRGSDGRTVSFGLLRGSGPRGTFRGLVAVAEQAGGLDPVSQFEVFAGSEVTLRLERSGEEFRASYSADGSSFTALPLLRADLSEAVEVGLGNFVGQRCSSACDEGSAADFDFFQIGRVSESQE